MARPWQRHRLLALPGRLALGGPRAHPPGPVLVVAVANDERQRRPQRPPVPEPGEHLHLVGLDLLARRAAVALLAPPQVLLDPLALEQEPGRQAGHDRDERRPVRLPGGGEGQRHGEKTTNCASASPRREPATRSSARRRAAPWPTRTSRPSTTRSQPAARAAAISAVSPPSGRYARSTTWRTASSVDEQLVPNRRRVEDEIGVARLAAASRRRRPPPGRERGCEAAAARRVAALGRSGRDPERSAARVDERGRHRLGRPARAEHEDARPVRLHRVRHRLTVRARPVDAAVADDERVHRPGALRDGVELVAVGEHAGLVRDGDVGARESRARRAPRPPPRAAPARRPAQRTPSRARPPRTRRSACGARASP